MYTANSSELIGRIKEKLVEQLPGVLQVQISLLHDPATPPTVKASIAKEIFSVAHDFIVGHRQQQEIERLHERIMNMELELEDGEDFET